MAIKSANNPRIMFSFWRGLLAIITAPNIILATTTIISRMTESITIIIIPFIYLNKLKGAS
jgi:hypothetical protein